MEKFDLNSKIYPILITALPIILMWSLFVKIIPVENFILFSSAFVPVIFFLISQFTRDFGRRVEKKLWLEWGGMPTTQLLSKENETIDLITKDRYHSKLIGIFKSLSSSESDFDSETNSTLIYDAWCKYLRTRTRDKSRFPLVHKELINYNFRRNLFALKKLGLVIATISIFGSFFFLFFGYCFHQEIDPYCILVLVFQFLIILMWLIGVTSEFVKKSGFNYAQSLLETIDLL